MDARFRGYLYIRRANSLLHPRPVGARLRATRALSFAFCKRICHPCEEVHSHIELGTHSVNNATFNYFYTRPYSFLPPLRPLHRPYTLKRNKKLYVGIIVYILYLNPRVTLTMQKLILHASSFSLYRRLPISHRKRARYPPLPGSCEVFYMTDPRVSLFNA